MKFLRIKNNMKLAVDEANMYMKDIKYDFEKLILYYNNFKNDNLTNIETKYESMIQELYDSYNAMIEMKHKEFVNDIDNKFEIQCNEYSKNIISKYEQTMIDIDEKLKRVNNIENKLKNQIDQYEHLDIATQQKEEAIHNLMKSVDDKQTELHLFEQNFKQIEKINKISEKLEDNKDGVSLQSLAKKYTNLETLTNKFNSMLQKSIQNYEDICQDFNHSIGNRLNLLEGNVSRIFMIIIVQTILTAINIFF